MESSTKVLRYVAVVLAVAAAAFVLYVAREYLSSRCYADMHKLGQDKATLALFETVGAVASGLRKGTASTSKWGNPEFQDEVKASLRLLAEGRAALKDQDAYAALKAADALRQALARAKNLATNRVNRILQLQNPADYDAYEKYRLEGKDLVEIVKQIDAALDALSSRSQALPPTCDW